MTENHAFPNGVGSRMRLLAAILVLCGLALAGGRASGQGGDAPRPEPEAFLSWNEPYGMPRASDRLVTACDDSTRADTLYVSFNSGVARPSVSAMEAVVYFHPESGDTLREFWYLKRGWHNEGNIGIQFDVIARFPAPLPWEKVGTGLVNYDHRSGRGRLDLSFVVEPIPNGGLMPDRDYCVARIILQQRRNRLPGCKDPVCIELASLRLKLRFGADIVITRGAHRFVTWNAAGGACGAARTQAPAAWRPPVDTGRSPASVDVSRLFGDTTRVGR